MNSFCYGMDLFQDGMNPFDCEKNATHGAVSAITYSPEVEKNDRIH
jgi:hypothetical protein